MTADQAMGYWERHVAPMKNKTHADHAVAALAVELLKVRKELEQLKPKPESTT